MSDELRRRLKRSVGTNDVAPVEEIVARGQARKRRLRQRWVGGSGLVALAIISALVVLSKSGTTQLHVVGTPTPSITPTPTLAPSPVTSGHGLLPGTPFPAPTAVPAGTPHARQARWRQPHRSKGREEGPWPVVLPSRTLARRHATCRGGRSSFSTRTASSCR